MLARRGRPLTLVNYTSRSYTPGTGLTKDSGTSYTVNGYTAEYKLSEIDNSNILMGDKLILLDTVTTTGSSLPEPLTNDLLDSYKVVNTQKLYNSTQVICYVVQVRL